MTGNLCDEPALTVVGERTALGPLRRELFPLHARWVNDVEVGWNVFGLPQARSEEQESAWLEAELRASNSVYFLIYVNADKRPIGVTSLNDIDHQRGTASFRILIGDARDRGHGYGTEVSRLVLRYAFRDLGLHNVMLVVFGYNEAGLRAYAKAGFHEIGRRRECIPRAGQRWDEVFMDCLATEFDAG